MRNKLGVDLFQVLFIYLFVISFPEGWGKGVVVVVVAGGGRVSIRQQARRSVVEKDEWFGS